jgi:hypothetical protein
VIGTAAYSASAVMLRVPPFVWLELISNDAFVRSPSPGFVRAEEI